MAISEFAKEYHEKMFPGYESKLLETDPEFIALFDNFAFDEVIHHSDIDDVTRMQAILAVLIGSQAIDEYKAMLTAALNFGVTPIEIKEIVYQAVAYLGIGRVFPFLHVTNTVFQQNGISLPLQGQSTTNPDTRLLKGEEAQISIFGKQMKDYWRQSDINYWLTDNCFGDYYTRNGLDYRKREMITFCFLYAQGGCEPQLKGHIQANIGIGNDKKFLCNIVHQCVPFIGYPRSLNALYCIEEVTNG